MHIDEPVPITLEAWPDGTRYRFDRCEYDECADRLRLTYGAPSAACARLTPEGHVVRVGATDPVLCGLVLTDVRRRLARDGRIDVTLGSLQHVSLGAADIAALLTGQVARRTNRFARTATLQEA